ncbi:T9SS type A sorting domain-containing protein [Brumimicrobium glaciale]|uniref:T9SS type A sorting domain-containing protein n=2 Tax=Brumimicrobium glaciale TaxID=200475 RepID=A0A4Q4KJD5_9FLAO|nr:T9SS type A sorting domain-containing protein [Brumimicrobium glaciale]
MNFLLKLAPWNRCETESIIMNMKRNKLILGGLGVVAIAAAAMVTPSILGNDEGMRYSQDRGSLATVAGSNGFREWVKTTMIDVETGEAIESSKLNQILKQHQVANQTKALSVEWLELGPDNIGGRTRAILTDHVNTNTVWAGGVSGGLFKSENRANNWSRVETFPGGPFISSIAQDAGGNIYVATGSNDEAWDGQGLFVSPDDGATWQLVPGTANFSRINRVAATKSSPVVYFTNSAGLKKYTFGGTVEDVTSYGGNGSKTLAYSIDGKAIVVASINSETWVSTNWGQDFQKVSALGNVNGKITQSGFGRIEYAISTKKSNGTYSIYAATTSSNNQGQWISLDDGNTWHKHTAATPADISNGVIDYRNQGTYNSVVSFDPTDVDRVIVGGIDLHEWKKQINNPPSGGWNKISLWFTSPTSDLYVHADNHELKWDGSNRLFIGNDGGIGVSLDKGQTFYPANRGYNITQFYAFAYDKNGGVIGGTQDNGSLYNNLNNATYQEFRQVSGGDGFTAEISFFNPKVLITSIYYNAFYRSGDGGNTVNNFAPILPGYDVVGGLTSTDHPFHTQFHLGEYYDTDSEDSVIFIPRASYSVGETILVPSRASGDTIEYVTPTIVQYDDTLLYDPSLTVVEYEVEDTSGIIYDLGVYNYAHLPSSSGSTPPVVNDKIEVFVPNGPDTVVVAAVTPYNFYFGSNASGPGVTPFGKDTLRLGVAWDTLTVQDPYQSWFVFSTNKNNGEIWGTRDALRLSATTVKWVRLMDGIGNAGNLDVAFSRDLNNMYVTAGSAVYRLQGLGEVYTSDADFKDKLSIDQSSSATTKVLMRSGSFTGVGVNPNNADDVVAVQGFNGSVYRSSNATSAAPTMTQVGSQNGMAFYDVIIDRDDSNILFAATFAGASMSENGGSTWTDVSDPRFAGVPSYEVRQAWRTFAEGNRVPGKVFLGTFGRGIWSSNAVLNVSSNDPIKDVKKDKPFKLELYPNPARYNSTLVVDLKESNLLDIQFYNISGRLVKRIQKTDAHVGRNEIGFSASELPQGTYILRVQSGNQVENTKFVKM